MNCVINVPASMLQNKESHSCIIALSPSLRESISALILDNPKVKDYLFDVDDSLRRFVNIFVDGEDIRALDGLDTNIENAKEVTIIMAVAGG